MAIGLATQANAQFRYDPFARLPNRHPHACQVTPVGQVVCPTPAVARQGGGTPAAESKPASVPAKAAPAQAPAKAGPEPAKKAEAVPAAKPAPPVKPAPAPVERAKEAAPAAPPEKPKAKGAAPAAAPAEKPKPVEKEKPAPPKAGDATKAPAAEELLRVRAADLQAGTQSAADLGYEVGYKAGYDDGLALGKVRILSREEVMEISLKAAREAIERKKKERK